MLSRGEWIWYCKDQGCGYYCPDCVSKYEIDTAKVMDMHVGGIRDCPVYWKKFKIKAAGNAAAGGANGAGAQARPTSPTSNAYLVSL